MSRGKGKSKSTTSRRANEQKARDRFAHAKEDAQLAGVLPIVPSAPEEALKPDRVPTSMDPLQGLPELVRQALKENWSVPGAAKPAIIAALLRPFFNEVDMLDADGNMVSVPPSPKLLNELAKTILALDQRQFERDNPIIAGQAKGGGQVLSIQANMLAVTVLREMFEHDEGRGNSALPPPLEPSTLSNGRFDGEVETGAASTSD